MKIAVVGASGNAGASITAELSRRGHQVTAIARNPEKIAQLPGVTPVKGDAGDKAALAALIAGHDAVVSSIHFMQSDADVLIGAVKQAGVPRYLVVGGAGSLEVAPGVKLFDVPDFPAIYLDEAKAGGVFLDRLKAEPQLDWTFLSPSALFFHGPRTGTFRLGGNALLTAADGNSSISFEDYAIALANEIETPRHARARFTVGY
ncbi:3-beta hydroxysteroid dehydrogenase [Azorhizobium oxalatiphilum]|uniref:3-beta hydroxysteroid dehydrogenase n=1 Tax=Azorhizobium oxalatiphilum TaxID=980631 RepID=A0A917CG01_9HYPH|nr:NAD(P)-dependent oxidoreductase [Azorhizobium oxalatiphilum]GGF87791.1 3-beta hydroxysteroid dehydrogenase [Azorhizobium oxalatiphilum]